MSNYVWNFGVKNYQNQTTIPQLIANNMSGFFSETRCSYTYSHWWNLWFGEVWPPFVSRASTAHTLMLQVVQSRPAKMHRF